MEKKHLLNLQELVNGVGNQLRYTNRYSNCRTLHKENVAEHQFYTAFFSLMIASSLEIPLDPGALVIKALIHDVEEQFTGDIVRPVKHSTPGIENELSILSQRLVFDFFYKLIPSTRMANNLTDTWKEAKDNTIEGKIVKFADFLSVLSYLDQEIKSGNLLVMKNINGLADYIKEFKTRDFDFIRILVDEAEKIVRRLHLKKQET